MLYDKWTKAFETADAELMAAIHHDDFLATFHSSGKTMTKADLVSPEAMA